MEIFRAIPVSNQLAVRKRLFQNRVPTVSEWFQQPAYAAIERRLVFFSFDGIDGGGKSTQIKLFVDWLKTQGIEPVVCRDPGSTPLGESLRRILLEPGSDVGHRAETLIYMAARAQLVEEVIAPALATRQMIVSDRFLMANVAYQGAGHELGESQVHHIGEFATDGFLPDLTFVLDLPYEVAQARLGPLRDRLEDRGRDYFQRVRNSFRLQAAMHPDRFLLVDAQQSVERVHHEICSSAKSILQGAQVAGTEPREENA